MNLFEYFLLFIIYSVVGWIIEIINEIICAKRYVNRGFLIGPYCPIYGVGALLMISMLNRYLNDPIALFVMAVVVCSILEYLTSFLMEKLFKARWWDYTNRKFNINGRICLETSILFGIGGLIIMYFANPIIVNILNSIPDVILKLIVVITFVIYLVDNLISFSIILGFRNTTFKAEKDNTMEITTKVKEILTNKSKLSKRLIKSFPDLKVSRKRNK